jgi:maltose alpha-D-glucosyltransferase / alpha-amylase
MPDLNYDNPAVQEAMLDTIRFWPGLGIDGFRLDAVTYLFEREGADCANLPETHGYLKKDPHHDRHRVPRRVLLAEANLWPTELIDYFGDDQAGGDECHMAFHFPLMPRIFMAVRRESRTPISEIMADTPAIPSGCHTTCPATPAGPAQPVPAVPQQTCRSNSAAAPRSRTSGYVPTC